MVKRKCWRLPNKSRNVYLAVCDFFKKNLYINNNLLFFVQVPHHGSIKNNDENFTGMFPARIYVVSQIEKNLKTSF